MSLFISLEKSGVSAQQGFSPSPSAEHSEPVSPPRHPSVSNFWWRYAKQFSVIYNGVMAKK